VVNFRAGGEGDILSPPRHKDTKKREGNTPVFSLTELGRENFLLPITYYPFPITYSPLPIPH